MHRGIFHERKSVQKQASLYAVLALEIVLFIMLIPQHLESFFLEVECFGKISLGETVKFSSSEPSRLKISSWNLSLHGYR